MTKHFRWSLNGTTIHGLTAVGQATIRALKTNHPLIVEARRLWVGLGWHPPVEDV